MRKILLFFVLLGGYIHMNAQETVKNDTVRCWDCESKAVGQPTDDRYRVVTNRFLANWFVVGAFGGHMFAGDGCLGMHNKRIREHYSPDGYIAVGKWFTPGIGAKVQYGIGRSEGHSDFESVFAYGEPFYEDGKAFWHAKTDWWDISVHAMFNLSRLICGYEGKDSERLKNQFIFSVGIGGVHHFNNPARRNEWSGHFELQYSRFFNKSKNLSLDLKLHSILYQTNFDGKIGGQYAPWDANHGVAVGMTYYFKKRHWDRCVQGQPVYNINQTVIQPNNNCPKYGVIEFYVFFPNNYSGRNDAPTVSDAPVNAIDYLASGIFTQTKFDNTHAVESLLKKGGALDTLKTSDVSTTDAEKMKLACGYEMSDTPISLNMDANEMIAFKKETGYFYAPMYKGQNTWYYRVDKETATQHLISDDNYKENKSFRLNAHQGLQLVRENMKPSKDGKLYSFADVYAALEGNKGNITMASNSLAVEELKEIFNKGEILYVTSEGLATSQDNFTGENSKAIGLERNKTLAFNRAYTVINWLKNSPALQNVSEASFIVNALKNPVVDIQDESIQGLNAKLKRSVKVRIFFKIDQ